MLDEVVKALREALGDNLYSCCLYGSAVRGNLIEGISDLNLLLVLNESNEAAHQAIARVLGGNPKIDPFILGRRGFERSVRAFAPKFLSIQRNYEVLHGADPLKEVKVDPQLERFLCEQALRNLRLRLVYAYVTHERNRGYGLFLARSVTPLFLRLSEMLRLTKGEVPREFEARIPLLEKTFNLDGAVLRDLLDFKRKPRKLSEAETVNWHQRVFPVLDKALIWMEANWPA